MPFTSTAQMKAGVASKVVAEPTLSISAAIEKGYKAAVLMWQIDAETGNRMSAQFSGVVVSPDGVILSAAHVVMPGNTYKVMFADGRDCIAKGLGRITIPPNYMVPDAAILKIAGTGVWPYAEMGWSSSLTIGQPCISIAYPESQAQRKPMIRFGKISSLKNEYGFVQSTCVMEPGDSGGPLFDLLGRVIGIHSGIQIPEDVNYEVPIDTYRKYWAALNQAKDYQALPADSTVIARDPVKHQGIDKAALLDLEKQAIQVDQSHKGNVVILRSILDGSAQQIAGTVLSAKGLSSKKSGTVIISKSSMLGANPVALDAHGRELKLRVVGRNRADDLVVLLAEKHPGSGIGLFANASDSTADERAGRFLISLIADSAARIGVLGSLHVDLPNATSYGYMGASTEIKNDTLRFKSVSPTGAAASAGIKAGDMVSTIDGAQVQDELDFMKAVGSYQAGDTIQVGITSAGKRAIKPVVLKYPPQRQVNHPAELFAGGKSDRRDGFKDVSIQDARIQAKECGGPVFDLNNRFVGINIARLSRTSTLIVPANKIVHYLRSLGYK